MVFDQYYETAKILIQKQDKDLACFINARNADEVYIEHDNLYGGIDYYRIIIKISINLFHDYQYNNLLEEKEKFVHDTLCDVIRGDDTLVISDVKFRPDASLKYNQNTSADVSMWNPGYFRLFVSHLTEDKEKATGLKHSLLHLGIDAFVAHEDIAPTKKWQETIENALFSMDALCAIITANFIKSKWCDQEVGIAMGQRKCVIPINKGNMPYGFLGSYQALSGFNRTNRTMAEAVMQTICANNLTHDLYLEKLINLLLNIKDKECGMDLLNTIIKLPNIEMTYIESLHAHFPENTILMRSELLKQGNLLFEKYGLNKLSKESANLNNQELGADLPF